MAEDRTVRCSSCGHESAAAARFCSQCGSSLSTTCPVCATVSEPGAKFCAECGTDLRSEGARPHEASTPSHRVPPAAASRADDDLSRYLPRELLDKMRAAQGGHAMEGERRTVTILFADIRGSTAAAERLDPEDWAGIVNGTFSHLIAPVYRYEGTLARLQGDAVLAFFGAPIAHEDDPVRALRAGLEMVEAIRVYSREVERAWGLPIEVRVGVNTGLVVVGEVGSDLRVEYTALGDAINVAARMEQTADPDTVRVTAETLSLTGGAFEAQDLGPVEVRGKTDPVMASRVLRFAGPAEEAEEVPLVGRTVEMGELDDLCQRLRGGQGWIASVIADAGVGKSRLLHEVRRHAESSRQLADRFDAPGEVAWLRGLSRSYDASMPFSTMADVLRRWWGAEGSGGDLGLVETAVRQAGLEGRDLPTLLAHLTGISLPDEARAFLAALDTPVLHHRVGDAFSTYLAAVARERPTVLVLEDLHWADDMSLALIDDVMDLTEVSPIGLLVAMRPYREEPTWRIHEVAERDHHHRYHHVDLLPLALEQGRALVDRLTGAAGVSADTKEEILRRSDGNPLFIEEMVREVGERGDLDSSSVPTSLAGILTSRLDRLPPDSQHAAQVASVLGSAFDRDLLIALLPAGGSEPVTDLLRREVLVESAAAPGVVAFRHPLIQEAAYSTILRRTRRDLHRRVADHLIETDPAAVEDISRHLVESGDLETAFPYLVDAGQRAVRAMSLKRAVSWLGQALENVPRDAPAELVETAHHTLGEAYSLVPDLSRAEALYQRLYEFGEKAARPSTQVSALNRLGLAKAWVGADLPGASETLEKARRLAEACGDEMGLAEYHMNACFVASMGGQPARAVEHDEATAALGEKHAVNDIRMSGLLRRATNYVTLLDREHIPEAIEDARAIIEERRSANEPGMEHALAVLTAFGDGAVELVDGRLREALTTMSDAQAALDRFGSFYAAMNRRGIGWCHYLLGDIEDALASFGESGRTARSAGQAFLVGGASSGMALVYATAGLLEPLEALRGDVAQTLDGPLGDFLASSMLADLGWVDLFGDDAPGAEESFRRGLEASSMMRFTERPRLQAGLALSLVRQGETARAQVELDRAAAYVSEKRFAVAEGLLDRVRGELLGAQGDLAAADEALLRAHRAALSGGQRLLVIEVLRERARLAARAGRAEEGAAHTRALAEVVASVASGIVDETLRAGFSDRWERMPA